VTPARTWTISELAAEFDTTLRTIRFYEDKGLLTPERQGQTRVFHERDRVRLQLVLRGKRLGFTLDETAHVINLYDETPGEAGQLEYLLQDLAVRRAALHQRRQDLDEALAELDELEDRCRADLAALRPSPTS
jgi:DNA-binding transcriptional MerR regulator